uniref:Uncharacterized protein n=1 Tax=Podoviridae sp. ctoyw14 TaxID=2826578 RepID=A0A8S5LW88_9CAUD|nr:MAG TPA: hypothetical protein [Podoviridae sp. ctoyw14]
MRKHKGRNPARGVCALHEPATLILFYTGHDPCKISIQLK